MIQYGNCSNHWHDYTWQGGGGTWILNQGWKGGGSGHRPKKSDPPILMVRLTASVAEVVSDATSDGSDNNDKDPVETLRIRTKIWWE